MDWHQFVMDIESLDPVRVEELFSRHGALAVTFSNAGDDPVLEPAPGETPLWSDTAISGLFDVNQDLEALKAALCETFALDELPRSRVEVLADRAWEREWLKDFQPMRFGRRLWVSPHACDVPATDGIIVRLDPGLAFGTGNHATTALCLEWLDSLDISGRRVLDVGCGSGILAISALLCGAQSATAVDIDRQAVTATIQNAAANGVQDRLTTTMSVQSVDGDFDVVIANILAQPLIDLAPTIVGLLRPHGRLALSGVLAEQVDSVVDAYFQDVDFEPPAVSGVWARVSGVRR